MIKIAISIICILVFLSIQGPLYCQQRNVVAFGMSGGYRLNNSGLYIEYGILQKWIIAGDLFVNLNTGTGYALSSYFAVYSTRKGIFSTQAGLSFSRSFGTAFSVGWTESGQQRNSYFDVGSANYLIPSVVGRFNFFSREAPQKGFVSFFLRLGYRTALGRVPSVALIRGDVYESRIEKIRKASDKGFGYAIGLAVHFGKKISR